MRATTTQVAARAGVSRATVDRVLNRRGGVSADKERAVLLSARALGLDRNLDLPPLRMLRVGVLMKPPENPFYERLAQGFREANQMFADQAIRSYVTHIDVLAPAALPRQLQNLSAGYDALVIVAPAWTPLLGELGPIATHLPVVTLATDLPLAAPHHYVGPSNHQAGRLAAELMGRMLGRSGGRILLVAGLPEFSGHAERSAGFKAVLRRDFPACSIAAEVDGHDDETRTGDAVAAALRDDPAICGIYNISQGNDGIADRVEQHRRTGEVVFIGHDLTPTTRQLLLARRIDAIIDQDPLLEARRAMELVLSCYGRWSGPPIDGRTPLRAIFRESLDDLPASGE